MKFSLLSTIVIVAANVEIESKLHQILVQNEIEEKLKQILAKHEIEDRLKQILAKNDLLDKQAALRDNLHKVDTKLTDATKFADTKHPSPIYPNGWTVLKSMTIFFVLAVPLFF